MSQFLMSDSHALPPANSMSAIRGTHDYLTLVALAALSFIAACVAHEAIGHGGACIAIGGHVTLLTSVYFHCSNGGPLTDAAGPTMNLVVGAACWYALRSRSKPSMQWRLFLALTMAFNLFWGAGYFVFSSITDTGDWAFVLRGLALQPRPLWLFLMGAFGVALYYRSMRLIAARLPGGTPLVVAYLSAGAVSCLGVLFFNGPVLPALREAAMESFGAAISLLLLARRTSTPREPAVAEMVVTRSNGWILASAFATLAFVATLGRGLA
jgi:hypothetical protein